jgi:acetylglutamate kinase
VTSPELLEIVQSVLCGHLNPTLVWRLQELGLRAVGLNGYSAGLLKCEIENPELGLVGKVSEVDASFLKRFLLDQMIPVIAPLGILRDGGRCNVNADLASCKIASALKAERLIFLTDTEGILDGQSKLITDLTIAELQNLEDTGVVKGGMFVKARAVKEFLDAHPRGEVFIANGFDSENLKKIIGGGRAGTRISN